MAKTEIKLGKVGKRKFKEIVEYLKSVGIYHKIDENLIILFAKSFEDYIRYAELLEKEGHALISDKGNKILNPTYTLLKNAQQNVKDLSKLLGIGEYSRKRIGIEVNEEDEFIKFLKEFQDDDEDE